MKTTLNKIRAHRPCLDGWQKLLRGLNKTQPDDEMLWIDQILDINGLNDALWCLRAVENCDREIRLYAVWCARRVQRYMTDQRSIAALKIAERYALNEASDADLEMAETSAKAALWARATAWAGAIGATEAARSATFPAASRAALAAAVDAAWTADAADGARDAERAAQADELRRVCREMREVKP